MSITIKLIHNGGNGFNDYIQVDEGETADALFNKQKLGLAENCFIRVNGVEATKGQVLENGDVVAITAKKIEGAII